GILEPYDVAAWSLPLMMGVKAEKVRLSGDEVKAITPIKTVPALPGGLGQKTTYYTCADATNNAFALVNAMQQAGGHVFLANQSGQQASLVFAAHDQLAANAEKLHVKLQGIADLPKDAKPLKPVRIGLYKPYIASIDEGWTRFVLEQY